MIHEKNLPCRQAGEGMSSRHVSVVCFVIPMLRPGMLRRHSCRAQTQQAFPRVSLDVRDAAIVNGFPSVSAADRLLVRLQYVGHRHRPQSEPFPRTTNRCTALLGQTLRGSDIAYTLRDKHIVLSKKAKNSPPTTLRAASAEPYKDAQALPLSRRHRADSGHDDGVRRRRRRQFHRCRRPTVGDTLEISLIGYARQTLPVPAPPPCQVVMLEDNEVLDAVVVTALGIKARREIADLQRAGGSRRHRHLGQGRQLHELPFG